MLTRSWFGRRLLGVVVLTASLALPACGGSETGGAGTTEPPGLADGTAVPATTGPGTIAPATSGSTTAEPVASSGTAAPVGSSPSVIGGSDDPATIAWRNRLLTVSTGYNQARATCFADPVACVPSFDSTLGTLLTGEALTEVRTNLRNAAAQGIRARGIDPAAHYYQGFQLFKEDPVDAALSLCVVDKGVQYQPAAGGKQEKIIDDSQATYFVVYRIQSVGSGGALRIAEIRSTEFVPLVGQYGQCDRYAR